MHIYASAICFLLAGVIGAVTPNHVLAWVGVGLGGLFMLVPI